MQLDPARYYRHAEIEALLDEAARDHPELVTLETIGASGEGRPIRVAVVTARATGEPGDKSGLWVDGNIHAEELAGSTAALGLIAHLVAGFGRDEAVTRALERHAIHVCPRLSPDGAEVVLTAPHLRLRSAPRAWPLADPLPGLQPADVDGDGEILQMRVTDPDGPWRQSERDERLLRRRRPGDRGGRFFRLYREGTIAAPPGEKAVLDPLAVAPPRFGLDLNRNFPFEWSPEQRGAEGGSIGGGPFPLSEPETRAAAAYLAARPTIVSANALHTFSGVILRPYSTRADEAMPRGDLRRYREIGDLGTRVTGWPARSCFHGFTVPGDPLTRGAFDDWCYDHLGLFAFTTELWSIGTAAGLAVDDFMRFFQERSEEDELAILAWNDREEGGRGFVRWRPFDHPQLGPVEIGGWRTLFTWTNPPARLLPPIVERVARFAVEQALLGPRLELQVSRERLGATDDGRPLERVRATVDNTGWLPTQVVERPMAGLREQPVSVQLEGGTLVMGARRVTLGHLAGASQLDDQRFAEPVFFGGVSRETRARAEWLIAGGGPITVEASAPRAGRVRRTLDPR